MICWYCNSIIQNYFCKTCDVEYHISKKHHKYPYYDIFRGPNYFSRLYARCCINSGTAFVFALKKHRYDEHSFEWFQLFEINNWKWAGLTKSEFRKLIESLMVFS